MDCSLIILILQPSKRILSDKLLMLPKLLPMLRQFVQIFKSLLIQYLAKHINVQ